MKKLAGLVAVILTVFYLTVCFSETIIDPATISVGDIVTFGSYEQDNNLDNGPEPIEWQVLDNRNDKLLLMSRYILTCKPYNNKMKDDVTWVTCSLRRWLNNDFFDTAFTPEEQKAIMFAVVDNSSAQDSEKNPAKYSNDTNDKVFLLSYHEADDLYFHSDEERRREATTSAIRNCADLGWMYYDQESAPCCWWLRSVFREDDSYAGLVGTNGSTLIPYPINWGADGEAAGVCPVIWINPELLPKKSDSWTCPQCGREGNTGNFCPTCAEPKPVSKIVCPSCGAEYDIDVDYIFCPNCARLLDLKKKIHIIAYAELADMTNIDSYLDTVHSNDFSDMGLIDCEWIVVDPVSGLSTLSAKVWACEGDLLIVPLDVFVDYAESGALMPLEDETEILATLGDSVNLSRGWRSLSESNESHLFGIPLDQLPGPLESYVYADRGFICVASGSTNIENAKKLLQVICRDMRLNK